MSQPVVGRSRHDGAFRDATLTDLALLPIRLDPETDQHAWGSTARLAARQGLTLYDAAYLELARRRDLPLASLDRELRAAALAEGVQILGMGRLTTTGYACGGPNPLAPARRRRSRRARRSSEVTAPGPRHDGGDP